MPDAARRQGIRDMLDSRYNGTVPITDAAVDMVLAALDREMADIAATTAATPFVIPTTF
jgi:hypothetical protein